MSAIRKRNAESAASAPCAGQGEDADDRSGLLQLAILSLAAGAVTGLVVALYRLCLDRSDQLRHVFIDWAHQWGVAGLVPVCAACGLATAVAGRVVRLWSPHCSGGCVHLVEE